MRCPHCQTPLDQLGHMEKTEWIPENLGRCRECKFGFNRFTVEDGKLEALKV